MGRRRLDKFMWGKSTDLMLCRASTLLIRLNIVPTKGRILPVDPEIPGSVPDSTKFFEL
jgi:hypothetical protein